MRNSKKGFTLAELLIVVAIIAVLVAISIPVFSEKLESSREATDLSNLRAAYAVAQADVLTGEYSNATYYAKTGASSPYTFTGYYNVAGNIANSTGGATAIGKGTAKTTGVDFTQKPAQITYATGDNVKDQYIKVIITETDGVPTLTSVSFAAS